MTGVGFEHDRKRLFKASEYFTRPQELSIKKLSKSYIKIQDLKLVNRHITDFDRFIMIRNFKIL